MKNKLQIVQSFVDTFTIVFTRLPVALRLGWVGFSLFILLTGLVIAGIALTADWQLIISEVESDADGMAMLSLVLQVYGAMFLCMLAGWLLLAPYTVVMKQVAAGTIEPPSGIAWFRFGGRELRYLLSCIILLFVSALVWFVACIPVLVVFGFLLPDAFEGSEMSSGGEISLMILTYLAAFVLMCWFMLRACLFTSAAAIENRAAPFSAFALTAGNVWRLLGAWLLYWVSIWAIETVLQVVVMIVIFSGIGVFAPLAEGGEINMPAAVAFGAVITVIVVVYGFFRMTLGIVFPARLYASLTRDTEADLIARLDDTPPT